MNSMHNICNCVFECIPIACYRMIGANDENEIWFFMYVYFLLLQTR